MKNCPHTKIRMEKSYTRRRLLATGDEAISHLPVARARTFRVWKLAPASVTTDGRTTTLIRPNVPVPTAAAPSVTSSGNMAVNENRVN